MSLFSSNYNNVHALASSHFSIPTYQEPKNVFSVNHYDHSVAITVHSVFHFSFVRFYRYVLCGKMA